MTSKDRKLPLLDAGRAIAALGVLFYHSSVHFNFPAPFDRAFSVGSNGVWVFFVITGFLLSRPFVRARIEGSGRPDLRIYAVRRLLRILPAYWVALTLAIVIGGEATPGGPLVYYGLAQIYSESWVNGGLGPAWTLCVEATYYLLLPLLAFALALVPAKSRRLRVSKEVVVIAVFFAIGAGMKIYWTLDNPAGFYGFSILRQEVLQFSLPYALDAFAIGMLLALMYEGVIWSRASAAIGRHPALCWLAALGAATVLAVQIDFGASSLLWSRAWQLVMAVGLLAPMMFGDFSHGRIRKLLAQPAILWCGVVSYSIYLYNQSVAKVFSEHMPSAVPSSLVPWVGLGSVLVGTLVVAGLSHRFIEAPAQKLGHRRKTAAEAAAAPVGTKPAAVGPVA